MKLERERRPGADLDETACDMRLFDALQSEALESCENGSVPNAIGSARI